MSLPDWSAQLAFSRLGWGVVVAAALLAIFAGIAGRARPLPKAAIALILTACLLVSVLPGRAGLGYWLLMAFQWPSALLVSLSAAACWRRWQLAAGQRQPFRYPTSSAAPLLPRSWALAIALAGALLYLDVSGWVAWGLYAAGFGAALAPIIALTMGFGCLIAIALGRSREPATILLTALLAYSLGRLPTGNLWDTMFDPLLWLWSLGSLLLAAVKRRRPSSKDADGHE